MVSVPTLYPQVDRITDMTENIILTHIMYGSDKKVNPFTALDFISVPFPFSINKTRNHHSWLVHFPNWTLLFRLG